MKTIWEGTLAPSGLKRARRKRLYGLDEALLAALVEQAQKEQRPGEEYQTDLLAFALAQRHAIEAQINALGKNGGRVRNLKIVPPDPIPKSMPKMRAAAFTPYVIPCLDNGADPILLDCENTAPKKAVYD